MKQKLFIALLFIFTTGNSQQFTLENLQSKEQIEVALDSAYLWMENTNLQEFTDNYITIENAVELAKNKALTARFNAYKAVFYSSLYDYDKFNYFLNKALDYYQKNDDKAMLMYVYNLKGIYESYVNLDRKTAIQWHKKAIEILSLENVALEKMAVDGYFNLAVSNATIENWPATLEASNKCIALAEKYNKSRLLRIHYYKGLALLKLNDIKGALKNFEISERLVKERELAIGKKEYYKNAAYLFGYSEVYQILGDYKKSIAYGEQYTKRLNEDELYFEKSIGEITQKHSALLVSLAKRKEQKAKEELKKSKSFYSGVTISLGLLIIGVLLVFILQLRKHEKQDVQKNSLLTSKNSELITIKEEVENTLKVKTDFLNSITHELRTPLYAINSITHMIKEDDEIKIDASQVDILSFSGDHLLRFINDVIDFNLGSKNFELETLKSEKTNIVSLLFKIKQTIKFSFDTSHENNFIFEFDPHIAEYLEIDALKLSRIILNLLNNASKYTKGGEIVFSAKQVASTSKSSTISFCIKDTGTGISKSQLDEIQVAFNNNLNLVKRLEHKASGLGMGLIIVNRLLKLYKSELVIESEKGIGTTITFDITFEIPIQTREVSKKVLVASKKQKKHILIVDDTKINQLVTSKIIRNQGNTCDIAKGGEEAIAMLQTKIKYDYILMDIMMPGMDGFQATKIIKSIRPEQKIIALTAISIRENKQQFIDSGFEHVIEKPFVIEKFDSLIS